MTRNLIAIDFDDTWTAASEFWTDVYYISPFDFVLVTMRSETAENVEEIDKLVPLEIPRVFCGGQFKGPIVQAKGYAVDIWIDDAPGFIWGNAWNPCVTLRDVNELPKDTKI